MDAEDGVGARLKARRKSLGMSATRLAGWAEVSREHLSAVENGHNIPSAEWVRRVELAMDRYAHQTGQGPDEEEAQVEESAEATPIRLTFSDVYGIGEIIAEAPAGQADELVAAVVKLLAEIRGEKGSQS